MRVDGLRSPAVVVGVRHLPRLAVSRLAPRAYRFAGTLHPRRAGVRVDVLALTPGGQRLLTSTRTTADGRWTVDRRFTGSASWGVVARTAADGLNRTGTSAPVRVAIP